MSKIFTSRRLAPLITCFVLAGAVALAAVLSGVLASSSVAAPGGSVSSSAFEIHFLSLNKSQLENAAKSLAPDYQAIGAGGYIWKQDAYYHIFSSAYANKNDALLVQSSLASTGNILSEIVSVPFPGFTISGSFDSGNKKALQKAVSSFGFVFENLYDIAVSLDTAVYNEVSARLAVNSLHATVIAIRSDFTTLFSGTQDTLLSHLSRALEQLENITKQLCSGKPISQKQTYASLIKYRYMEALHLQYELSQQLQSE